MTSKQLKRLVREYAGKAHELELRQALMPLAGAFQAWERSELDSFELSELIHTFHQRDARELFLRYAGSSTDLEPALAGAIARGVLASETIPKELLEHLARLIEFMEDQLDR